MAPSARSLSAAMLATAAASPLSLSELRTQVGGGVALRVLPIGDAATYGSEDVPNGYRAELADLLEKDGNKVEIVGTTLHGEEPYNAVEASPKGETIDELASRAETAVPGFLPNVVIVNAGTADCEQDADGKEAGDKVVKILELAWDMTFSATVVLATSPLSGEHEIQQCVDDVNNKFRNLVQEHQDKSHKVVLVDLDADTLVETGDDGLPTEDGYKTIAQLIYDGIDDAGNRGWLEAPEDKPEDAPEASEEEADSETTSESPSGTAAQITTAVFERRQEVIASQAESAVPTSISQKELDAIMNNVKDGSFNGNQRRQEGSDSATSSAVFSPPLDGQSPTTTAAEAGPTDAAAILAPSKELLSSGKNPDDILPDGVKLEDLPSSGVSNVSGLGNQRRQMMSMATPLPTSAALPALSEQEETASEAAESASAFLSAIQQGRHQANPTAPPSFINTDDGSFGAVPTGVLNGNHRRQEAAEQLPPTETTATGNLASDPESEATETAAARRDVAKELKQALPSGVTVEDLEKSLPSGVKLEDALPSITEALKNAKPTGLDVRDIEDGLAGLAKDIPGVDGVADALSGAANALQNAKPTGLEARDIEDGLAGLAKDIPGIDDVADALSGAAKALENAKRTGLDARDIEDGLAGLAKDVPGLDDVADALSGAAKALENAKPTGLEARDIEDGLAGLVKDIPGVEEVADALPGEAVKARSVYSGASGLAVSGAAALVAVGLGFALA